MSSMSLQSQKPPLSKEDKVRIIKPKPKVNPNSALKKFQTIEDVIWGEKICTPSLLLQFWINGGPHSPSFPSKEDASNDRVWVPIGILPTKWLKERFKNAQKDNVDSCEGMFSLRELNDKSNNTKYFKFVIDKGKQPKRALGDKLRVHNAFKFIKFFEIGLLKWLDEKYTNVKVVMILTNFIYWPSFTTIVKTWLQWRH